MRINLSFFFLFPFFIYSQSFEIPVEYFVNNQFNSIDNANYTGSPFLYDNFKPATIFTKNKNYTVNIKLNAYSQTFQILQNETIAALNFTNDMKVQLGNDVFIPLQLGSKIVAANLLYSQNYKLYKYFLSIYTPEKPARSSYDKSRLANYDIEVRYALEFPDGELKDFKLNKKNILVLFGNDKVANLVIKKNKLKFRKESELVFLLKKLKTD